MELIKNVLIKIVDVWQMVIVNILCLLQVILFLVIVGIGVITLAITVDFDTIPEVVSGTKAMIKHWISLSKEDTPE